MVISSCRLGESENNVGMKAFAETALVAEFGQVAAQDPNEESGYRMRTPIRGASALAV